MSDTRASGVIGALSVADVRVFRVDSIVCASGGCQMSGVKYSEKP